MPALDSQLRSQLDVVCQKARDQAVAYAQSALQKRGVDAAEALSHFGPKDKELRNRLRARGRQVGDVRNADGTQSIEQLSQELAYEYWHRMLFARFLAENHLLMHPDGVAVSLEECDELAPEADPPAANGFVLAARYASTMLPQIFRTDDVLLEIEFAPEQRLALEKLLASLPKQTFEADDSLGWVYQFWQTAEKKRVNDSGDKIDGRTLPAVTQLFTEHYMVEFLLHNTIGAWWCAKEGIQGPPGGAGIPAGKSPVEMPYLRWRDDGTPAAGKFEGWPKTLAEFTMLDPCCGSGHFLVAAFNLLVPLRMHDEGLSAAEASEAVLRDNIFGLELDPRCTQIAAFALAVAAWKYPDAGGYRSLPTLNIACSGQGVTGRKDEWLALANGDNRLREGMDRLYDLFRQAPHLGSLIDPAREKGNMYEAGYAELQPLLTSALSKATDNADLAAVGVAAQGIARAAAFLAKKYSLVLTNVPYLGRGKQNEVMQAYCETHFEKGKADLATSFVLRCLDLCNVGGCSALVTPQNWFFLSRYTPLREKLLTERSWNSVARLGPRAFETISGEVVNVTLVIVTAKKPEADSSLTGIDVADAKTPSDKANRLTDCVSTPLVAAGQASQLSNPDARIVLGSVSDDALLSTLAQTATGLQSFDTLRFFQVFWERGIVDSGWLLAQSTVDETSMYDGRSGILRWEEGNGDLFELMELKKNEGYTSGIWKAGSQFWGRRGIIVSLIGGLKCSIYDGHPFDNNAGVIIPNDESILPALWAFCSSSDFCEAVRQIDQKMNVTNATLAKIPFNLEHWQSVASERYPSYLPGPHSDDPTQWLFKGDVANSTAPLQVSVARLLGYRWPEQPKTADAIDTLADNDGIVCLPGVRGEPAAAERLLELLRTAYGTNWSDSVLHKLLTDAGCKAGITLDDWLRNQFFEQHCKRFLNRPFIWHIWDGRKDGFSALVNYHKLTHKALENLTYSYLGDWITAQSKSDKAGADLRLGAAQALQEKLKLILAGEPPYDIFVRWKPLHEQAIGWNPDLNDGVRMNIRPFMEAGILRKNPNIKWTKDRGKEPQRDKADYPWFWSGKDFVGDRVNDIHLTNAEKQAARSRKKGAK
jgi:hypothetical protein